MQAQQLDKEVDRQQAFDQRWTIRWDANQTQAVDFYEEEVERRVAALSLTGGQDQTEAALEGINNCVWGAAKAVGIAKEIIPLPPIMQARRQADREVFSMGVAPEKLWFDAECDQARLEARRAERQMRLATKCERQQGTATNASDTQPSSAAQSPPQSASEDYSTIRERFIEAVRKYRLHGET